ncbi:hypothetical protein EDD86DRAFT_258253 [Gorgonomyces haynaldii]|nr:hypothetical protein EDD86DRAFT_258253 [Gorgonomyces haynaldii]
MSEHGSLQSPLSQKSFRKVTINEVPYKIDNPPEPPSSYEYPRVEMQDYMRLHHPKIDKGAREEGLRPCYSSFVCGLILTPFIVLPRAVLFSDSSKRGGVIFGSITAMMLWGSGCLIGGAIASMFCVRLGNGDTCSNTATIVLSIGGGLFLLGSLSSLLFVTAYKCGVIREAMPCMPSCFHPKLYLPVNPYPINTNPEWAVALLSSLCVSITASPFVGILTLLFVKGDNGRAGVLIGTSLGSLVLGIVLVIIGFDGLQMFLLHWDSVSWLGF